jgi:hypothetical protein
MKKIIVLTSFVCLTFFVQAQKGQFSISAGTTSNPMAQAYTSNQLTVKDASIPIHAELGYYLTNKLQIGLSFNTSKATSEDKIDIYTLTFDGKATSYMLRVNYFYINKEKFKLGSGLALGVANVSAKAELTPNTIPIPVSLNENGFGIHLNLLDARYFFTENLGIYTTVGFQDQGKWGVGLIGKF